jgi:rhomboid family GlyGly-CTERM serine protease
MSSIAKAYRKLAAYWPLVTILLTLSATLAMPLSNLTECLVYDQAALSNGQVWRAITGHVTHWNWNHFVWDALMFAALGALIESRSRWALIWTLVTSAVAISLTLWLVQPEIIQYRGLSGLDSALFAYVLAAIYSEAKASARRPHQLGAFLLAACFAAKIGYECLTGLTLFVDSESVGFRPLPSVHAVGAICGLAVAGLHAWLGTRVDPVATTRTSAYWRQASDFSARTATP